MSQEYVLFDEPYPIKKKVPTSVSTDVKDVHFPPSRVYDLKDSPYWVRDYWNQKNLKRRPKSDL